MRHPTSVPLLRWNSQEPADNQSPGPTIAYTATYYGCAPLAFNPASSIGPAESSLPSPFPSKVQLSDQIDVQGSLQDTRGRRHRVHPQSPRGKCSDGPHMGGAVIWSRQLQVVRKSILKDRQMTSLFFLPLKSLTDVRVVLHTRWSTIRQRSRPARAFGAAP